jgi:hypothetical protein
VSEDMEACPKCHHAIGQSDCYCGSGCACRLAFATLHAVRARAERFEKALWQIATDPLQDPHIREECADILIDEARARPKDIR